MRIAPAPHFRGVFRLPGDKSISHRLALLAALAEGETVIENYMTGVDGASTLSCLRALGVEVERGGEGRVVIRGTGRDGMRESSAPLDAGNSGSTLRMLSGVVAGRPFQSVITGDASLLRRPVERVAAPLREMGAAVETAGGKPPLQIRGGALRGISWESPVASAQVKTAVLLAGVQADGETTAREPRPSRDHTERWLPVFGAPVSVAPGAASLRGPTPLSSPGRAAVPGDVSSAAFFVVAALVRPDSQVVIEDVLLNPGRTAFLDVLRRMGGDLEVQEAPASGPEPVGTIVARSSRLRGTEVGPDEVPALIDEIPALAVAAAYGDGEFTVTGASELRVKESDRIAALADGLSRMGADVQPLEDGLCIQGGAPLTGAAVDAYGDHRIAMALSIAALGARGETEIAGASCAAISFPEFFALLAEGTGHPGAP